MKRYAGWVVFALIPLYLGAAHADTTPRVQVTEPVNNQTVTGPFEVVAKILNNVPVQRVDFYIDGLSGSPAASATSAPYRVKLHSGKLSEGLHNVGANAVTASGVSFFNYVQFYVARSSGVVNQCADTVFQIRNQSTSRLVGLIEGTRGAMGSGGWSAEGGSVTYFELPTAPRVGQYTGDYGVHIEANSQGAVPLNASCEAVIPNKNGCSKTGLNAMVTFRERGNKGLPSLQCAVGVSQ